MLKLIKAWEDIENIKLELAGRKQSLVVINKKYFSLIDNYSVIKTSTFLETLLEPMIPYNAGSSDTTNIPILRDGDSGGITELWINYDIDFFNIDLDIISNCNSEIILSGGPGPISVDTQHFKIYEFDYSPIGTENSHSGRTFGRTYRFFTQFSDDLTHIRLTESIFFKLIFNLSTSFDNGHYYLDWPLPNFYSKLILEVHNPREFI